MGSLGKSSLSGTRQVWDESHQDAVPGRRKWSFLCSATGRRAGQKSLPRLTDSAGRFRIDLSSSPARIRSVASVVVCRPKAKRLTVHGGFRLWRVQAGVFGGFRRPLTGFQAGNIIPGDFDLSQTHTHSSLHEKPSFQPHAFLGTRDRNRQPRSVCHSSCRPRNRSLSPRPVRPLIPAVTRRRASASMNRNGSVLTAAGPVDSDRKPGRLRANRSRTA